MLGGPLAYLAGEGAAFILATLLLQLLAAKALSPRAALDALRRRAGLAAAPPTPPPGAAPPGAGLRASGGTSRTAQLPPFAPAALVLT